MEKSRKILSYILLSCLFGCIPNDDDSIEEIGSENFVVSNPEIPLFLQIQGVNGETIGYYGEKDSQGRVLNCNLITVQNTLDQEPTLYLLDDQSRMKTIYAPTGEYFEFDWINNQSLRVKAVTANGEVLANVPFNGSTSNKTKPISKSLINDGSIRKRSEIELHLESQNTGSKSIVGQSQNLNIEVTRCGESFTNGFVGVKAIPNIGDPLFYQSAANSNGVYQFNIATSNNSIDFNEICSTIDTVLGYVCDGAQLLTAAAGSTEQICTSISLALDLAFAGPTGEAVILMPTCEAIIRGTDIACTYLGGPPSGPGSPGISGSPSILSGLCGLFDKQYQPNSFVFEPRIYVDGEGVAVAQMTPSLSTEEAFPDLEIELPDNPRFSNLSTSPFDPAPGQDYTATASINCGIEGLVATITVTGTDGFSDSKQLTLPKGNSQISILVPGAEAAVTDFITVRGAGMGSLNASIIF